MLLIWSVLPTFSIMAPAFSKLGWFVTVYLMGGFLRKYQINLEKKTAGCLIRRIIVSFLIPTIWKCLVIVLNVKGIGSEELTSFLAGANKLPVIYGCVCMFLLAKRSQIQSRVINWFGGSVAFAVYLLHCNRFFREFLFKTMCYVPRVSRTVFFIPLCIGSVVLIYLISSIIEHLRLRFIAPTMFNASSLIIDKVEKGIRKIKNE